MIGFYTFYSFWPIFVQNMQKAHNKLCNLLCACNLLQWFVVCLRQMDDAQL